MGTQDLVYTVKDCLSESSTGAEKKRMNRDTMVDFVFSSTTQITQLFPAFLLCTKP